MGAIKGRLSPSGFTTSGSVQNWEKVMEQLTRYRFKPVDTTIGNEHSHGWVRLTDPFETDFTKSNIFFGEDVVGLQLRVDTVQISASQLKLHVQKRIRDLRAERGGEELTKVEQTRVKDDLRALWVKKVIPTIKLYEVVFNTRTGRVWFFGKSRTLVDTFREIFHETFGLLLTEDAAFTVAQRRLGEKEAEALLDLEEARFGLETE